MPQYGSEDVPRGPENAQRRLQEAKSLPKEASKRPKYFKHLRKINVVCLLAFSLPMAIRGLKMAPRGPKRAPRGAQESPKTAPRALQERSKRGPRGDFRGSRGAVLIGSTLFFDRSPPRWPQEAPRRPQEAPKMAPRGLQEVPKRPPRGPQEAAMRLQEAPKRPQEASKRPPRVGLDGLVGIREASYVPHTWTRDLC